MFHRAGATTEKALCLIPCNLASFSEGTTRRPSSLDLHVWAERWGWRCSFRSPRNPEQKIIKRVIALEGDIIKTIGYKKKYVKVPHGHMWVEGDHRGHSFDSNAFGPVSLGLLHARATHILWPPERWQKLQPKLPPERQLLQDEEE
uniref:Mitochondrial inner membrane protease subunit 2 n=1 Tax=Podarcis muralis TaxID=64176 RepID=A0A670JAU3_PODMU